MVRVEEVEDNYVLSINIVFRLSSFNLFRLCNVKKLRQTSLIAFPVFFQSLSPSSLSFNYNLMRKKSTNK